MGLSETVHGWIEPLAAGLGIRWPEVATDLIVWGFLAVVLFTVALSIGGLFTLGFRKLFAWFGQRQGPNRVGPWGLLQPLADGIKLLTKDDVIPRKVDRVGFRLALYLSLVPFVVAWAPLPFSDKLIFADLRIGLLFILAVSALPPMSEIVAGWASNNKYAMYGGLRAAALDFAYEVPLVISAFSVVLLTGSLQMSDIVEAQRGVWFFIPLIIGAFIFFVSALAKNGTIPMDLPESESELVAGFTTEYSGMRFGMFFVGIFSGIFFLSALTVTLFFGGWLGPSWAPPIFWFLVKTFGFCFLVFWIWSTLPRVRIDQFLHIAWKSLFPLALLNLAIAIAVRELGWI